MTSQDTLTISEVQRAERRRAQFIMAGTFAFGFVSACVAVQFVRWASQQ